MASTIKLEIVNLPEFLANLEQMEYKAERGMTVALYQEAERTMRRATSEVPTLTGALAGSGFVGLVGRWAKGLEVKFGFGSPYALYQHFGNYEHDDGKQKFLEDPVRWSRRGLVSRMKAILVRALR